MFQLHIVDLDIAIPLQQYDPSTKLTTTDNITPSGITTQQSIPKLDKTTISTCSCDAIIRSSSFKVININFDSIIGKRFSQLIRTITSTHLIEPIDHLNNENNSSPNSNLLNIQPGNTKNILENIDESDDDDERIKRLEYEHLISGQKIEALKRSQTSYETLKAELTRYEWLSGHNRDRNRIDPASYKRTQSYDPSRPSHHTQFPSQDPSMFDDHQSMTTNTPNEMISAPAVDLELNFQIQIASGSCNLYTSRDLISNSSFTTANPTKQQQSQKNPVTTKYLLACISAVQQKSTTLPSTSPTYNIWSATDATSIYTHLSTRGYQYGSSSRNIQSLCGTTSTVIDQIHSNVDAIIDLSYYHLLHPIILDMFLQPSVLLLPGVDFPVLPVSIQKFVATNKMNTSHSDVELSGKHHNIICGLGQERAHNLDILVLPSGDTIDNESMIIFEGLGLFAVEKISKGEELIYEYDPLVEEWPFYPDNDRRGKYTEAELFKLIENNPKLSKLINYQAYMVDDNLFNVPFKYAIMDSDTIDDCEKRFPHTLFINHSCDPNIGFIEVTKCYALRDIDIGEEITQNYGCLATENSLIVGIKCQCGSKDKCQQILRMDFYKDPIWRQENERYCFPYVKKKIQELLYNNETIAKTAIIEQQMSMTDASMFWRDVLHGYKLDRSLPLPFDRYRLVDEDRTGRGISVSVDFGEDLSHYFLHYASSMNIKLEHLVFAIDYAFMFKLTNGETDLCVAVNTDSQHRDEFKTMIDLFENIVPLRCQLDPHWSFQQLMEHTCEIITSTIQYSYFPLKRILAQYSNASKPAFLDTSFEFLSNENVKNKIMFNDSRLRTMLVTSIRGNDEEIMSNFDFSLTMQHNSKTNQLSCTINGSLDLFNRNTIEKIGQRFHSICKQLFASIRDQTNQSIYELSLVMPDERLLLQSMNNTEISFSSPVTFIHHEFVYQVMKHPQKLAVELDEQSLTYCELLHYVQMLSLTLRNEYHVFPGEVVCQCVERSVSMVIGIMGIEMAGGVYCPLSPRDPQHRLHALTQQTQSRLVLAHYLTKTKFLQSIVLLDIDLIVLDNERGDIDNIDGLSDIIVASNSMAYIIFTSGSTGTPKAAQVRHRNFSRYMYSLVCGDVLTEKDTILQISRCSFDTHVQDIMGTLSTGATLVMLHPGGIIDLEYLTNVIRKKNVTCFTSVPTILQHLFDFVKRSNDSSSLISLQCVCTGGEKCSVNLVNLILSLVADHCKLWNFYGPAEATIVCTFYRVSLIADTQSIPIGRPLSNYQCMTMNEYLQSSANGQEGDLYVGGVGVFAGYLERDDLTAKALVEIDGELFYRTGDLVTMDNNGLLHYRGRKDHQIKLHGQRIELGEIERCLLNIISISACIVMKWNDNYLVAYVQSSDINEVQLREHCQSHLPPHMIPSVFIILDKLPLNQNGKIDRKLLLPPDFSSTHLTNSTELLLPTNEIEVTIHQIWCDVFLQNQISIDTNIFTIGGHSLLLIQLYQLYSSKFHLKRASFCIANLYQHLTIIDHARFISQLIINQQKDQKLLSEEQSFPVEECIHIDSEDNIVLIIDESSKYQPFPVTEVQQAYLIGRENLLELGHVSCFSYEEYDLPSTLDIERLEQALNYLIHRHESLRTIFPSNIEQKFLEKVPYYRISVLDLNTSISVKNQLMERRKQLSHQIRPANRWPLFDIQVTRFTIDDEFHIRLHIGFDLLIRDFWSWNLIMYELNELYLNPNIRLAPLKISYRDYVLTESQYINTINYHNDKKYWIDRLNSFPLGPNLPLRCTLNEIRAQRFHRSTLTLDKLFWQKLRQYISAQQLSPAGFLASAYAIILSKWSENQHFTLNLPIFNRLPIHSQINDIVGDFTTILPLEIDLTKPIIFIEFVRKVQKQLWNDLDHVSYNGVSFIRDLMHIHQTKGIVLPYVFTCGIDINNINRKNTSHHMFSQDKQVYGITQTPQVLLDHIVYEHNGNLLVHWDYVQNLFSSQLINDIQDTFIDLLQKLALFDEMWQKPLLISLPLKQQERRLEFNQTQWKSNIKGKLLHSLVIKQAELTPDALAILSSKINLTYKQLMNHVYSLAYHLQQQEKYSNQLVAILMTKGWEQVVACLAILVSGGAYLPLDVDSPNDRLCSLIEETNVTIILTQSHCEHAFPYLTTISVDTLSIDDNYPTPFPIKQQSTTDLAYVIYTSGSTGKPKGVMISHQAVVNTILDMNSRLEISTDDRIFALSHLNFDLSVYDIFGILIGGGTIVIPNHEDYKNPEHWYDMIMKYHVTIWNSVPMLMQMFVEHLKHTNNHNQLRHILLSGDWMPLSLPKSIQTTFGEQVTITSLGGATEASIWSIAYTLPKKISQEWKSIPYGIPLRNQQYYVYDMHLDDCPEWVIDELYIGGEGLANGYWNDQEKTQSSFIIHPLTSKRLYRTGDYGRFLPNGYIEFTGRKDFQVKVHGHRIELGEIEHHLQQHPDIQQAIVNYDDKSQHLIGYIMPETYSIHNKEYDSTEVLIVDPIERINFKLARHSIRYQKKVEKSFALTKPKLTETLINTYYMRKSYRQFTNETIERSTIEKLLKNCHNSNNNEKISLTHLDFGILSQLLAVLTSISISDQPLPKYRYASAGSLYPVQVYVELPTFIDNISPGVYYYDPDEHTLELIGTHINDEMMNIRLHLVGRSSAIAPLYGKRLGSRFCMLETGYIMGLLEKEGSKLGLTFSKNTHNESITRDILNIDENDTHCCFKISSFKENISKNIQNDNHQCIIYLKSVNNNKDQWFVYNKEYDIVTPFDVKTETTQEKPPLFFDDDDDAKIIFHDCQCAIFFSGQSEDTINIGKLSHLLMDHCLEMNIGMCPIGARTSFPKQINDALDTVLIHEKLNGSNILHTLLIGKISNKQKYEHAISKVKSMPNWSETLRIYLKKKLPMYMVPSHFMSVSSIPLSPNGKIDRKALPEIPISVLQQEDTYNAPNTELEQAVANIWQEILYKNQRIIQHGDLGLNKVASIANETVSSTYYPTINVSGVDKQTPCAIPTTASFSSVGGNSLLLVKIYQRYQSKFNFETEALSIQPFFGYNTIREHAKLLETVIIDSTQLKQWHTLNINEEPYVAKPMLSRSASVYNDVIICEQKSNNLDRLSLWYKQISSIYTNIDELQFMNWGYADLDEHTDDNTGYYSKKLYQQVLANVTFTDRNILEVGCGRGAGAAWCVRTYAPRSYVGTDPSRDVINLCQQCYSTTPRLSFMIADPETHLPLQNESMNVVLSIETTNLFDEREAVKKFVDEITRVLTPNGYFLWCGLCNVDGSSVLIDYLIANNAFIIKEKVNITRNVLHALDIQRNSHADFIERYIQPADQEYCRLFAGLPGTQLYDNMQQGCTEYWRVGFRKKIIKKTLHIQY
ncbi:unnamed protein product [Adineta steineri]|uniref:Carrier domain-containing protein n=1 Tax=Adineta steineri TaxID=433720 RepID=A0A815IDZ1_9BILA|nr:unnamed protein product [Adineta steineri]CAF1600596.1 unnamed protein product [Adineta steineri]